MAKAYRSPATSIHRTLVGVTHHGAEQLLARLPAGNANRSLDTEQLRRVVETAYLNASEASAVSTYWQAAEGGGSEQIEIINLEDSFSAPLFGLFRPGRQDAVPVLVTVLTADMVSSALATNKWAQTPASVGRRGLLHTLGDKLKDVRVEPAYVPSFVEKLKSIKPAVIAPPPEVPQAEPILVAEPLTEEARRPRVGRKPRNLMLGKPQEDDAMLVWREGATLADGTYPYRTQRVRPDEVSSTIQILLDSGVELDEIELFVRKPMKVKQKIEVTF
jgi:hypothetical protein